MTNTRKLTDVYFSFFKNCANFAVSPYTATFKRIARTENRGEYYYEKGDIALAAAACTVLTFVVPVLPVLTAVTFAIAKVAAVLALFSMIIAYPIALVMDGVSEEDSFQFGQ